MAEPVTQPRIGILGYGVIGRRLAAAVDRQHDMQLVAIGGRRGSISLQRARDHGYATCELDQPGSAVLGPEWLKFLSRLDVLLDCTPSGVPDQLRDALARFHDLVTIVQGGESHFTCETSFNSMVNYAEAAGRRRIRVLSCSSTGTTRFLYALHRSIGVQDAFLTLARRGADPGKLSKVPANSLAPTMGPSHHARDVNTVLPSFKLTSISVDCPTTFGHVLEFHVQLSRKSSRAEVLRAVESVPRILVDNRFASTTALADHFRDQGRHRFDHPELYVFADQLSVRECALRAAVAVHMESITIPETIDCVRAALRMEVDPWRSIRLTDESLGIAQGPHLYRCDAASLGHE